MIIFAYFQLKNIYYIVQTGIEPFWKTPKNIFLNLVALSIFFDYVEEES